MNNTEYIEYDCTTFTSFDELQKKWPILAKDLSKDFDDLDKLTDITVYPTPEDYALYELEDGWYINNHLGDSNYNGAPNPLYWMDLDGFGKRLVDTDDGTSVWMDTNENECSYMIVTTADGFILK